MRYKDLVIVIVEDNLLDITYLLKVFQNYKITNEIKVFTLAQEALDYIIQHKEHYLVLVDMCLPGMHGTEFIKELKKLDRPEITYLVLSSEEEVIDRFKVNLDGAIAFLPKPICKERLIAIIEGIKTIYKKWEVQAV